ncbi:MAG: aminomethyl-transferring glycine dehydrogenase [bacterium]
MIDSDKVGDKGDVFARRHIGPDAREAEQMLQTVGARSLEELVRRTVPENIRLVQPLRLPHPVSEREALAELKKIAAQNKTFRSYIGMGYHETILPPVIQRNVLENPAWYTPYTPYQAEIAQGRLEALLNFQTMIMDLTGMDIANASLLDEATAAAEAMMMCRALRGEGKSAFFVSELCHPQTISVVQTRASALGVRVVVGNHRSFDFSKKVFGVLLQYPATDGVIHDFAPFLQRAHEQGALAVVAADLLALTLLRPPSEFGADIVVGSAQRFGLPMGFGGPHAAFFATREEFKRQMPGRLVGVSKDSAGQPALRLALQTREQHIRREKATSNICTAQVLPAVIASMYAVYHGPEGLRNIAKNIHDMAQRLAAGLVKLGHGVESNDFFDTLKIKPSGAVSEILARAKAQQMNLRKLDGETLAIALGETVSMEDIEQLLVIFNNNAPLTFHAKELQTERPLPFPRQTPFLQHPVFNTHHSETEMMRYLKKLETRDYSLVHGMIPLGSCTMKLNAAAEMMPITWPELADLHPFAPLNQTKGYQQIIRDLENWLAEITGLPAVSLQPNAGSQGEFAGMLAIRRYHESRKQKQRDVCLIPASAHGTNPASATMAGMKVVAVSCDEQGNINLDDFRAKAEEHKERLAACMITYPSTHGVFETNIREVCRIAHDCGAQVYLDGANMNAQVGLCSPASVGADVCHLNLHKTFAIPHGGGGPGAGPITVAAHLAPFLPGNPLKNKQSAVSSSPWGSALILAIPWVYIRLMSAEGLTRASQMAILNANYIAARLGSRFPVLYKGANGLVAHECILDMRPFKAHGIEAEDVAKRLMDYGFHAPTLSFPVPGTLMVEPTECEPKAELDRFCEAMILIHQEIQTVASGRMDAQNNPLKNAPHTAACVVADEWNRPYSRKQAVFPTAWTRQNKFWPAVGRIDNVHGDRNLFCSCQPLAETNKTL